VGCGGGGGTAGTHAGAGAVGCRCGGAGRRVVLLVRVVVGVVGGAVRLLCFVERPRRGGGRMRLGDAGGCGRRCWHWHLLLARSRAWYGEVVALGSLRCGECGCQAVAVDFCASGGKARTSARTRRGHVCASALKPRGNCKFTGVLVF